MHKTVAIVVLAAGLAACGVIDSLVDGLQYAKAVETDLVALSTSSWQNSKPDRPWAY
jgi:hypothetical protein